MNRHNTFISYHHKNDQIYRDKFELLFDKIHDVFISKSVQIGEIDSNLGAERIRQIIRDKYLRDTTVTIVLIGEETWKRKHVDWEISSSIRDTQYNSRAGLLGIILPTYPRKKYNEYTSNTIPPRLSDNIECDYAKIYNWSENPYEIKKWIHEAFLNRRKIIPINSRLMFKNNKSQNFWT